MEGDSGSSSDEGTEETSEEEEEGGAPPVMDLQAELAAKLKAKRPALEQSMEVGGAGDDEAWSDEVESKPGRVAMVTCLSQCY